MAVVFLTLKDRVGFQHLLFDPGVLPTDGSQKLQDQFGALRLSGSRLTTAKVRIQVNFYDQVKDSKKKVDQSKSLHQFLSKVFSIWHWSYNANEANSQSKYLS